MRSSRGRNTKREGLIPTLRIGWQENSYKLTSKLLPVGSSQLHEQSEAAQGHDSEDAPCVSSSRLLEFPVLLGS